MFRVKHIMSARVVSVSAGETADEAIRLLVQHHLDTLPVVDEAGNVVGAVTSDGLLDLVFNCWPAENRVANYMTPGCPSVEIEDDWLRAADLLRSENLRTVPVTDGGRLVGTVSSHDLLRTIRDARSLVREVLAQQQPAA